MVNFILLIFYFGKISGVIIFKLFELYLRRGKSDLNLYKKNK